MLNALTVDVEDYFHPNAMDGVVAPADWDALPSRVEANTRRMLDLLAAYDVRATFFVLGWVAQRWPDLVRAIAASGHELACHGFDHRLVYRLGPARFRDDVTRARAVLEDAARQPVQGFRAASYSIVGDTLWALDVLIELGFAWDSSIFPIRHDLYGIPSFSRRPIRVRRAAGEIVEIPASTVRLLGRNWPVAGGGWLRALPFGVTRWALRRLNDVERVPAMVYVHPWELDVDQPRLAAGVVARTRQTFNLRRTEPRLRRLLREFRFAPIREAFAGPLAGTA